MAVQAQALKRPDLELQVCSKYQTVACMHLASRLLVVNGYGGSATVGDLQ
jgi:hypothetical protein